MGITATLVVGALDVLDVLALVVVEKSSKIQVVD